MIDHKEETPNEGGIVIDLDNENEFEENNDLNEFEDDNDFLVEEEPKEDQMNIPDQNTTVDHKSETTTDSTQALNNDNLINPQNEQMLFDKLGE